MTRALRLLNSSPLTRLIFFGYLVVHHVYVFLVFAFHLDQVKDASAPPGLRGGRGG